MQFMHQVFIGDKVKHSFDWERGEQSYAEKFNKNFFLVVLDQICWCLRLCKYLQEPIVPSCLLDIRPSPPSSYTESTMLTFLLHRSPLRLNDYSMNNIHHPDIIFAKDVFQYFQIFASFHLFDSCFFFHNRISSLFSFLPIFALFTS